MIRWLKIRDVFLKQKFLMSDDHEYRIGMRVQFEGSHEKSTDFPADVAVVQLLGKTWGHDIFTSIIPVDDDVCLHYWKSSINPI